MSSEYRYLRIMRKLCLGNKKACLSVRGSSWESNWKEFLSQPEVRNVALVCLRVRRKRNKSVYGDWGVAQARGQR